MKNTKVKIAVSAVTILLATILLCIRAYAVIKISFPLLITNGTGTINVSGNEDNEKIYYQAIIMTDEQYQTINKANEDLTTLNNDYKARFDPKKAEYEPLRQKVNAGEATQEENAKAEQLYKELSQMKNKYNQDKAVIEQKAEAAHPKYDNVNWIEAESGKFSIDNTTREDKYYVLWAKVGDTVDKIVYKVMGKSDPTIVSKEISVEVGKEVELTGADGTDLSTITWTSDDATISIIENNKVKALKVGATTIRGTKNGKEVINIGVIVRAATTGDIKKDIPSDAKKYNGHAYYYFSGSKSWEDAKAYCEKIGGHLVTITTKGEADFIKTLTNASKAWIGGYKESNWKWVTGEKWNYEDWNEQEPGEADKLALVSGKWSTLENNNMGVTGFICEWDDPEELQPVNPSDPTDPTQPINPSEPTNPTDPSNPGQTKEQKEQLIYRQDGIKDSTTNPKSTSGDQTIATKKIPQTGESIVVIVALVIVAGASVVLFVNYRKNK